MAGVSRLNIRVLPDRRRAEEICSFRIVSQNAKICQSNAVHTNMRRFPGSWMPSTIAAGEGHALALGEDRSLCVRFGGAEGVVSVHRGCRVRMCHRIDSQTADARSNSLWPCVTHFAPNAKALHIAGGAPLRR
jgi:hypothetical protein